MKKARSPAPSSGDLADSSWPTEEPSSSTRSETCRPTIRSHSCGCCRTRTSSEWAEHSPTGSLLSAERLPGRDSPAAGAARRHSPAGRVLHRSLRPGGGEDDPAGEQADTQSAAVVSVAGERARTAERDRALDDSLRDGRV